MKKYIAIGGIAVCLVAAAVTWLQAAPSVGDLAANPPYVTNTTTSVVFTVPIFEPNAIPVGVNLLRTDVNGRTLETVGAMRDDGLNGDVVAKDNTFTYQMSANSIRGADTFYRASVAVRGTLQRIQTSVRRFPSVTPDDIITTSDISFVRPVAFEAHLSQDNSPTGPTDVIDLTELSGHTSPGRSLTISVSHLLQPISSLATLTAAGTESILVSRTFRTINGREWLRIARRTPDGEYVSYLSLSTSTTLITVSAVGRTPATLSEALLISVIETISF